MSSRFLAVSLIASLFCCALPAQAGVKGKLAPLNCETATLRESEAIVMFSPDRDGTLNAGAEAQPVYVFPDAGCGKAGQVTAGSKLNVSREYRGWYEIQFAGDNSAPVAGWVRADQVTILSLSPDELEQQEQEILEKEIRERRRILLLNVYCALAALAFVELLLWVGRAGNKARRPLRYIIAAGYLRGLCIAPSIIMAEHGATVAVTPYALLYGGGDSILMALGTGLVTALIACPAMVGVYAAGSSLWMRLRTGKEAPALP